MKISILQPQVIQELGCRNNQEDSIFPKLNEAISEDRLFVLCDGMGGHENGEVASQLVCQVLPEYIKKNWDGGIFTDELFYSALDEVFQKINEYDSDSFRKMGTTLTFLCLHKGGVMMAHIGDSRIYHIRPSEHLIIYKSRDHSLAYDLFLAGEISYDELTTYKKNVITRAIMPNMGESIKADIAHATDIKPGDYFLLCSDGMLEEMNDKELVDLLSEDTTDEIKRETLIEKTKHNKDNHSAILVHISDVEVEDNDDYCLSDETVTNSNAILLEKEMKGNQKSVSVSSAAKRSHSFLLAMLVILASMVVLFLTLLFVG